MMNTLVQWVLENSQLIIAILLIVSEAASSVVQLLFPDNKGVSGIFASVIKFLQGFKK